jgi:hypothetical protein
MTPRPVALMLRHNKLVALVKDIGGLHFIVVGEVFLQLISHPIISKLVFGAPVTPSVQGIDS